MDWKRLVQFALLGSSDLEQYAILLVRAFARAVLRHLRGKQIVCRQASKSIQLQIAAVSSVRSLLRPHCFAELAAVTCGSPK